MIDVSSDALLCTTIFGSVSLLCSLTTLYLIYSMRRWNEYLKLVAFLTIAQAFYDVSVIIFPMNTSNEDSITYNIDLFISCTAGVAKILWSNVISYVVLHVVLYFKVFVMDDKFIYIFLMILIFSFTIGIMNAALKTSSEEDFKLSFKIYNFICVCLIFINICVYIICSWKLYERDGMYEAKSNIKTDPLKALVVRLKYYPIVQTIFRLSTIWYDLAYGYGQRSHLSYSDSDTTFIYFYSIMMPSAGIGYFMVFMFVTPGAQLHLWNLVFDTFCNWKCFRCFKSEQLLLNHYKSNAFTSGNQDLVINILGSAPPAPRFGSNGPLSAISSEDRSTRSQSFHTTSTISLGEGINCSQLDEGQLALEIHRLYNVTDDLIRAD